MKQYLEKRGIYITWSQLVMRIIFDLVVLTALKAAGTYDVMHGLVANLQPNPRCEASDKELEALYQQALPLAVRLITEYVEGLSNGAPLDKAYDHTFGEF